MENEELNQSEKDLIAKVLEKLKAQRQQKKSTAHFVSVGRLAPEVRVPLVCDRIKQRCAKDRCLSVNVNRLKNGDIDFQVIY
jgi:hypothetical protein